MFYKKLILTMSIVLLATMPASATYLPVIDGQVTIEGRVFANPSKYFWLHCYATTSHNCSFFKQAETSAYTPSSSNKFCLDAYKFHMNSGTSTASVQGLIAQSDNAIPVDDNTALTNPVYCNGTDAMGNIWNSGDNTTSEGAHLMDCQIANGKYVTYKNTGSNTVRIDILGHEGSSCP